MDGFEPGSSDFGIDRFAICSTTTAMNVIIATDLSLWYCFIRLCDN